VAEFSGCCRVAVGARRRLGLVWGQAGGFLSAKGFWSGGEGVVSDNVVGGLVMVRSWATPWSCGGLTGVGGVSAAFGRPCGPMGGPATGSRGGCACVVGVVRWMIGLSAMQREMSRPGSEPVGVATRLLQVAAAVIGWLVLVAVQLGGGGAGHFGPGSVVAVWPRGLAAAGPGAGGGGGLVPR